MHLRQVPWPELMGRLVKARRDDSLSKALLAPRGKRFRVLFGINFRRIFFDVNFNRV